MKSGFFLLLLILIITSCLKKRNEYHKYVSDSTKSYVSPDSLDSLRARFMRKYSHRRSNEKFFLEQFGEENFDSIKNLQREIVRLIIIDWNARYLILRIENRSFSWDENHEKIFTATSKESEIEFNNYIYESEILTGGDDLIIKSPYLFKQTNRKIKESEWAGINNLIDSLNAWDISSTWWRGNHELEWCLEIYRKGRYKKIRMNGLDEKNENFTTICYKIFKACPVSPKGKEIYGYQFKLLKLPL